MSELLNNSEIRKQQLKRLILRLHEGESEDKVRSELLESLSKIPYGEVVEVEQELIQEGLPEHEILRLCDAHSSVLNGHLDLSAIKIIPEGHPVDVMKNENFALKAIAQNVINYLNSIETMEETEIPALVMNLRGSFNSLFDVDKHYKRKEYLLFPFLEKYGITGPPTVMWGKHDEIRELLTGTLEILKTEALQKEDLLNTAELVLFPVVKSLVEMIQKEEEILFPMSLDKLTEADWYEIDRQSLEIGYCLYDPMTAWKPEGIAEIELHHLNKTDGNIHLPSGIVNIDEMLAILNHLPIDITFVDKNDKVKYFSQGTERVFQRNRAILNRDVRLCHPPASAHIVDKIIDDFRTGKENSAPFWINMGGKMIHIEYFALRNENGEYLGTLEVSHNVQKYRDLVGEQRILSYSK